MFIFVLRKLVLFYIFWLATKHFFATESTEANFSLHRIKERADGLRVRSLLKGVADLIEKCFERFSWASAALRAAHPVLEVL
jgi:hypothetical protein